ncbi:hypothetical protein QJS10_CPA08g00048 [Acorus calamus]|uniref:GTD-binding domain-containing protein n=1 Tax=Acorus calamus TaxID=4465 RepID=A0AAV9EC88_ACOCL|nr:hypothetical protein QJS10_CPA08g00048 [Acorus calamus]
MDSDFPPLPPTDDSRRCCSSSASSPDRPTNRSVKRKLDEDVAPPSMIARVETENEVAALRETVSSQQQTIQDLYTELEEERSAASTAASEAMSMILRLQREKAEAVMDARQFRRYAEEKIAHDQRELLAVEDLLYKREQAIYSLNCEIRAYKHRMMSFGVTEIEAEGGDYPPLKASPDLEKYPDLGEEELQGLEDIEFRIYQLEKSPSFVMEKGVIGQSPKHNRKFSVESLRGLEDYESNGGDEASSVDRVCTIDSVEVAPKPAMVVCEEEPVRVEGGDQVGEEDIKKLYMRLQALEADRESMKQVIVSMRTDRAQLILLREIAQQLCKDMSREKEPVMKRPTLPVGGFSFLAMFKWIGSLVLWRKKSRISKYMFGSSKDEGLLLLLERSPHLRQWRCITRRQ